MYYCLSSQGLVFQDDVELPEVLANDLCLDVCTYQCTGTAYAEQFYPYDPDAEYRIEAFHSVDVTYEQQTGYYDVYNYGAFLDDPVYYPYWYNFISYGPRNRCPSRTSFWARPTRCFQAGPCTGRPTT